MRYLQVFLVLSFSCFGFAQFARTNDGLERKTIFSRFSDWEKYHQENILVTIRFRALNEKGVEVSKDLFFKELIKGDFIALAQVKTNDRAYKLHRIDKKKMPNWSAAISQWAYDNYENYKMIGKRFPEFKFYDLENQLISNDTFSNGYLVVKCWFLNCAPCLKEIPALNQMVARFIGRKDLFFLSFAEDGSEKMRKFLERKPFSYKVIADSKEFMSQKLDLNSFPTHFIVNKKGIIRTVSMDYEGLEAALLELTEETDHGQK